MPDSRNKFYLTTPIYYVNARPHIGHAYTTIVADVLARRHRLLGDDTFFLTGTDEHGQKIERSANAAGIPPQQFADGVSASFHSLWDRMGITYDDFIRTTELRHQKGVQHLFQTLKDRGYIYLSTYTGQYCVSDEAYVDGPPGIRCPDCGRVTETVSESNYYFRLSAFQLPLLNLIESGPNGEPPQLLITPESRRNEVLSFLRGNTNPSPNPEAISQLPTSVILSEAEESQHSAGAATESPGAPSMAQGDMGENANGSPATDPAATPLSRTAAGTPYAPGALKDLSISRTSFKWGIPVPGDEAHVIYVWLDALANYMTAIGYGSDTPEDTAKFEKYWPADLHLVGKEIIRFHCVYWPAFLLAAGLPTPKAITAHGWLLFQDSDNQSTKMSKSLGNIVRTKTILDTFGDHYRKELVRLGQPEPTRRDADLFASDVLRYFLLREIPFGQDGSFSFEALITRYNAELANGYGNLVSRVLKMISTNFEGVVPHALRAGRLRDDAGLGVRHETEKLIRELVGLSGTTHFVPLEFQRFSFSEALFGIATGIAQVDMYLAFTKPWMLARNPDGSTDWGDLPVILYTAAESIRILTALLYPFLPYATAKVWAQLGLGSIEAAAERGDLKDLQWGGLQAATQLGPLSPIFPRAPKELAQTMADIESTPKDLTTITEQADATNEAIEFSEGPLASVTTRSSPQPELTSTSLSSRPERSEAEGPASPAAPTPSRLTNETTSAAVPTPTSSFAPDAGPRTGSLREPDPIAQVAGSIAHTTERSLPPSHTEAHASGPFASAASIQPITAHSSSLAAHSSTSNPVPAIPASQAQPSGPFNTAPPITADGSSLAAHNSTSNPVSAAPASEAQPSGPFNTAPPITADNSSLAAHSSTSNPVPAIPSSAPNTSQITIDDFAKVELRVAKIVVCERIPKAGKLLRLEVDLGPEMGRRQILSGIAEWYTPEDLVGRKIVVITNLASRKMRGLESHGMLLAASTGENGKPALATFDDSDQIEPGARLK